MAGTLPSASGSDPILTREAEIMSGLMDAKIAVAHPVPLGRVVVSCDGHQHVQLPNGVACCPGCGVANGPLVPVYSFGGTTGAITGSIPYVHASSAGQPTIVGGSSAPAPPAPSLPARYLDSVGNLWSETGAWISAGNTPAAVLDAYRYYGPVGEGNSTGIKRVSDGALVSLGSPRRIGSGSVASASPPARTYDSAAIGTMATGALQNDNVVLGLEFLMDAGTGAIISGPTPTVRPAAALTLLYALTLSASDGGTKWSVSACPDGTWITHKLAAAGTGSVVLHRLAWLNGTVLTDFGPVLTITNDTFGGKTTWVADTFIKQVQ